MSSRGLLPKHVRRVKAKGKEYFYFDTGKLVDGKKVWAPLPSPRSSDFGGTYATLLGHRNRKKASGATTIPQLVELYWKSPAYRGLASSSKSNYDIYLRKLIELLPTAPAAEVTRGDMRKLIAGMADRPGAANLFLGACGAMFKWAAGDELISVSPTKGIQPLPMGEHQPWPQPVLNAALDAKDAQVRLLTHLLLYTALRLNDALSLTWGHIEGGKIIARPKKSEKRGQVLAIPIHKALAAELAKWPRTGLVIAVNPNTGRRYGETKARNLLQDFAANLGAEVVPHGLRKNAVNALLEAGCSVAETAAISGQTLQLVEHYAKQRDQSKLADSAVLRWEQNG